MAQRRRRRKNNISRGIRQDLKKSANIANNVFDISPLSQVDASRTQDVQNLINQNQALSDPFSQAFAGRRSGQLQDYVSRLSDLTQGYDSREMNALREQRRQQMERGFSTGRAALDRGQNAARVSGTSKGAQLMQLAAGYGRDSAAAENDLFVRGADEKRRAITQYGDTVRQLEADEFGRGQTALQNYRDVLETARANELERQKINLGQEAADRAVQSGATLGVMQLQEARRNARRQNKLIREGYRSNERTARGSGGGGGLNVTFAQELEDLAEEYK